MTERTDPLREQIAPYREFGDVELAVTLLAFEKTFGGPGIHNPATAGQHYHCPNCEEDVRGVSRDMESIIACPLCGDTPGLLVLGRGTEE